MKKFTVRDVKNVGLLSMSPLVVSVDGDSYTSAQLDRAFSDNAQKMIFEIIEDQQKMAMAKIASSYDDVKKWVNK